MPTPQKTPPKGTLVTAVRRPGALVARGPRAKRATVIARKGMGRAFDAFNFEPYGLAWDGDSECLWMTDKANNVLWDLKSGKAWKWDRMTSHRLPGSYEPCMVDVHPKEGVLVACYGR